MINKKICILAMAILACGLFASVVVQTVAASECTVTLYEHKDYGGKSKTFTGDVPYVGDDFNDIASSLKVAEGCIVTLYEDVNYLGKSKIFTGDASYLGDDFNDIASSLKVSSASETTVWQATDSALAHKVGYQVGDSDWKVDVSIPEGFMVYGPYIDLPKGNWKVTFRLKIDSLSIEDEVARLEITSDCGGNDVILSHRLMRKEFLEANEFQDFSAVFPTTKDYRNVEFRIYYHRTAALTLDYIKLEPVSSEQTHKNILFCHGFYGNKGHFDDFVQSDCLKSWNIMRTSVSGDASMQHRAGQLADYLETCNIPEGSIKAVGHSMGGLDLRALIDQAHEDAKAGKDTKYTRSAKKIRKVYTIGTPHKGAKCAGLVQDVAWGGAWKSLTPKNLENYNNNHHYKDFEVGGRHIPLLAFTFDGKAKSNGGKCAAKYYGLECTGDSVHDVNCECSQCRNVGQSDCVWVAVSHCMGHPNDGVVETYNQKWDEAPWIGPDTQCHCSNLNHDYELKKNSWVLEYIVDDWWL